MSVGRVRARLRGPSTSATGRGRLRKRIFNDEEEK
jgi:hypothetical protein